MGSKFSFIIILITIITLFLIIFLSVSLSKIDPKNMHSKKTASPTAQPEMTASEKQKIDNWIYKNKLNPFGDSYDTVYTGGTPLFDEVTGAKKDKYQYILEQHPDRPWNK